MPPTHHLFGVGDKAKLHVNSKETFFRGYCAHPQQEAEKRSAICEGMNGGTHVLEPMSSRGDKNTLLSNLPLITLTFIHVISLNAHLLYAKPSTEYHEK